MPPTLALDIYGTLIDPFAVKTALTEFVGDEAGAFSETWRTKQLEYSFRRGLMGTYVNFTTVTRAALDYSCLFHKAEISEADRQNLMDQYRKLDAFDDVAAALTSLKESGVVLHAFSNGVADDIETLLHHAGLRDLIQHVISADELGTFKPDPRLYIHFLERANCQASETWLVSSNPFDIIGASACGWHTAWVQRNPAIVFDPWEQSPDRSVTSLTELPEILP